MMPFGRNVHEKHFRPLGKITAPESRPESSRHADAQRAPRGRARGDTSQAAAPAAPRAAVDRPARPFEKELRTLKKDDSNREFRVSDKVFGALMANLEPSTPRHATREDRRRFPWDRGSSELIWDKSSPAFGGKPWREMGWAT